MSELSRPLVNTHFKIARIFSPIEILLPPPSLSLCVVTGRGQEAPAPGGNLVGEVLISPVPMYNDERLPNGWNESCHTVENEGNVMWSEAQV